MEKCVIAPETVESTETTSTEISLGRYLMFDSEFGHFYLKNKVSEQIYHNKNLICSYSGINEWCHYFFCQILDFYSGNSIYNYALGTICHEKEIQNLWKINPQGIIDWLNKSKDTEDFQSAVKSFEYIIDNAPNLS